MSSGSIYVCQNCGKQIILTKEEKALMSEILCEKCRKESEEPIGNDSQEILNRVINTAGNLINKYIKDNAEPECEPEPEAQEGLWDRIKSGTKYIVTGEK